MASSGTYDFTLSNGEVVLAAYERVRVRAPSIRIEHMITARRELNLLLAEASNRQVNLWKVELMPTIPMLQGVATYAIPPRVIMILDAWIAVDNGASRIDRYITPMSRTDYSSIAAKMTPGAPTSFWFDRLIAPTITMWPVADGSGPYTLYYYACVQMQDANLPNGETPDLPYRWLDWFTAGLAHRLARIYAPDLEDKREKDANRAWQIAAAQDTENVNLSLAPPLSQYYRR